MRLPDRLGFRGKTLWDWLQLLIVPAILIAVTFAWSATQTRSDNKREDRRIDADRVAAREARQDATLQTYLNQMSALMLDKKLLSSKPADAVRSVARTVTLTTLRRLSGERKGEVVRFLHEARLIATEGPPVVFVAFSNLTDADLASTQLHSAYLGHADLRRADLTGATAADADLTGADLRQADFTGAYLSHANFTDADLTGARLKGAFLGNANFASANLQGAHLSGADLAGAKNLDLGRFMVDLPPVEQKRFLDSQKAFLDSLSRAELAKFNLTPEKLAKLRREASGG